MAPVGVSLHIGVDSVEVGHYQYTGKLLSCEKDAEAMFKLATDLKFQAKKLIGPAAQAEVVRTEIKAAAEKVRGDGVFFLSVACHGGQVPSTEVPPEVGEDRDEICALYDRMLIDDELAELWTYFAEGARIVVQADACHSGTITTVFAANLLHGFQQTVPALALTANVRALPANVPVNTFQRHEGKYREIQQLAADRVNNFPRKAIVMTLSACQDNELAQDGAAHGLFTSKVLEVAAESPTFNYETFMQRVRSRVMKENAKQSPRLSVLPDTNTTLQAEQIFKI